MNAVTSVLGLLALIPAQAGSPTMRGVVVDKDGKPVVGARVDIATGAPRVGKGLLCPSCYRDCSKWTRTDKLGRFAIEGLDETLKFTLLATAPGKKGQQTGLFDPLVAEAKIVLEALPAELPRERTVIGQLVDDHGKPVAGALIQPYGAETADRRWGGQVPGVTPSASDAQGSFSLVLPEGYRGVDIQVTVHGYAGRSLTVKPSVERQRIVVPAGTRVTGRLVQAGKPMAGMRIAVVQIDRGLDHFIKAVDAVTDVNGKFGFNHLPAGDDYAIFSPVGEGTQKFVLSTKRFKAFGDRQERDLKDLEVITPLRLAGRIDGPPGDTLPPGVKITLGRDPAWDLIVVPVKPDGTFVADGLPPETYRVGLDTNGFEIDEAHLSYQKLDDKTFGLRLLASIEDLRIPLRRMEKAGAGK